MNRTTDNDIRVELKYCERCGGLWFRRENSREVFCVPCKQETDAVLRHTEHVSAPSPERKPGARLNAGAWYGPMSDVIERLQGIACGGAA